MRPDNGILLPVVCGYVVWWYFRANVPTPHVLHSDSTNTVLRGAQRKTVATTVFQSKIKKQKSKIEQGLIAALLVSVVALSPLIPWTIRNLRVFHVFQPLAARYANNPDEDPHLGFQQWTKTWMGEYVSVVEVYWHVTGEEVDPKLLPSRAFDSTEQREKTFDLFDRYNEANSMPPELDQQFADLARERRQHSRFRYYVWLPAARIVDMWLRPRTEMIGIMERWWDYETDPVDFAKALAYGVLNLLYVAAGVLGMIWRRKDVRFAGMLIGFVVLRSVFLGTIENPEPRYTLELFPVLFVFGAALLSSFSQKSKKPRPA
jgi:hypothetical protein